MLSTGKKATGRYGEDIACDFLRKAGYKIVARNYSVQQGELDIIASKNTLIVFVEVKTRKSLKFGSAGEAVTWSKRQHIISAALSFLQKEKPVNKGFRFDVIEVYLTLTGELKEVNHIVEAFISSN